jgi:hypothetical protein
MLSGLPPYSDKATKTSTTIGTYARRVAYCSYMVCDVVKSIDTIGTMGIYSTTEETGAASS